MALPVLKDDYYGHMSWNTTTGHLKAGRAQELGMAELLAGYTD